MVFSGSKLVEKKRFVARMFLVLFETIYPGLLYTVSATAALAPCQHATDAEGKYI